MENSLEFPFEDYEDKFEKLNPRVRQKAIEIAKDLISQEHYTQKSAVQEAILRAESWFLDLEG